MTNAKNENNKCKEAEHGSHSINGKTILLSEQPKYYVSSLNLLSFHFIYTHRPRIGNYWQNFKNPIIRKHRFFLT